MGFVLAIYSENVYQEFILPTINNTDYSIVLPWKGFSLYEDMVLDMEVFDGKWRFCEGDGYQVYKDGKNYIGRDLQNNDILVLQLYKSVKFAVMVRERENTFNVYKKYLLPTQGQISIGSGSQNHIVYNNLERVSGNHAVIEISQNRCILRDLSKNGVYINHVRSQKTQILNYGDTINIIGLQIVYIGSFLAIDTNVPNLKIDEETLYSLESGEIVDAAIIGAPERSEDSKKNYFNRMPRTLEPIDSTPFEIEAPPAKDHTRRQPLYLTLGPSVTMAIPMALGCMMSLIGSGGHSSVFMYTGLVTAFGSAIIGSVWGYSRIKYEKKRREEEEAHRLEAYEEYLNEKEEEIRERYTEDAKILAQRYPEANVLCAQDGRFDNLWNRNATHVDFMYHRLGTGDLPFPSEIIVPPKRFVLYKDKLAERPQEIKDKYEKLKNVPIGVDLLAHPLVGIVGGTKKEGAYEIVKLLLTQIAASNCYTDVKIALTYDRRKSEEKQVFDMFRWLPHTWSVDKKIRYVADDKTAAADVYYELTQILRARAEAGHNSQEKEIFKPLYVLVVSDLEMLNNELISKYIFEPEENYGLITLLLVERYQELPNSCEYIIENSREAGGFVGIYSVRGEKEERIGINYDTTTNESVENFARKLSDIEVEELETGGELPASITFFEMAGINKLEELDVVTRWAKNRTYDSMRGLLGQKAGGAPVYLDVHEKYHGPHGLVAGTTGSGKSETLQTYILSLAINYSPDDIGFFVIDYKGGGMANLFSGLPHLMGQISNLSGNQVHRAMVSIKSENRRRQRVFNEHGVNNINSYTKLIKNGEAKLPVPHLFIIIDEFAELKREEPDFMRELISVAQVGRSLGVHLILATQKPSGTVDDNIWSNSKFRLCLRVQDKQDSNDMLHKPDAAYITQAGRGYLQVGNDELYELFQSGWSGAAYDDNQSDGKAEIVKMYAMNGHAAIVGNRLKMQRQEQAKQQWYHTLAAAAEKLFAEDPSLVAAVRSDTRALRTCAEKLSALLREQEIDCPVSDSNASRLENIVLLCAEAADKSTDGKVHYIMTEAPARSLRLPESKQKTQLDAIVDYLAVVAEQNGYNHQFLLWLPVLPENLYLDELQGYKENSFRNGSWPVPEQWDMRVCIGLCDDPANQSQTTLELDFAENGHHVICGAVGTGKSTFVQTLIYSLTHRYSPDYVNLYIMDFSSNAMRAYEKLAHVGGVMYENDIEIIGRCFYFLDRMMEERKALLKGGNYEQYVKKNGVTIPAVFLVIDQYSNFREKTENAFEEQIIHLSRDGAAYGIYLVITAAGFGMTEISNNIGKNIKTVVCLEMGDKFQYADVLHTMQIQVLPESGVRGRGLVRLGDRVLEYQTALSVEGNDDYSRIEKIAQECERLNSAWTGERAFQVPRIPEKPVLDDLMGLVQVGELLKTDYALPIGYDYANAMPYYIDFRHTFGYLVSGKAKTGKTNLLKIMILMAAQKNLQIYVADFSGKLRGISEQCKAQYIDSDQKMYDMFLGWKDQIVERNQLRREMEASNVREELIFEKMAEKGQVCLFIDNLPEFLQHMYYPEKETLLMHPFVENITEKGAGLGFYYFCAYCEEDLAPFTGMKVCSNLLKKKTGIHLGGNVAAQRTMNFDYVPYNERSRTTKPGVGLLSEADGEVRATKVIIPLV